MMGNITEFDRHSKEPCHTLGAEPQKPLSTTEGPCETRIACAPDRQNRRPFAALPQSWYRFKAPGNGARQIHRFEVLIADAV